MKLFDMHCHVDLMPSMEEFCLDANKRDLYILAVTTTPKAYAVECEKLKKYKNIYVALGLHPQLVAERYNELNLIEQYIKEAKYIGEIGLDFSNQYYHSKELQQLAFEKILAWCAKYPGKVISIHAVRSDKQVIDIIEKSKVLDSGNKCILHWYSGSLTQLKRAIKLGCYFSFNSYMVSASRSATMIKEIPINKLLLESDAPFLDNIYTIEKVVNSLEGTLRKLSQLVGTDVSHTIKCNSHSIFNFGE